MDLPRGVALLLNADALGRWEYIYPTQSNAHHAAVDEQLNSANEAAVVRGQEYSGLGDIQRSSNLSGGHLGDDVVLKLGDNFGRKASLVEYGSFDRTGADHIDAYLPLLEVHRPGAAKR